MNIADIFKSYTDKVSQIYLYQRAVKDNAKNEFEQLVQYEKSYEKNPELKDIPMSTHNLFFHTARGETPYFMGYKQSSLEDMKLAVVLHKNKQYHWLLAEAYEAFEDFIEDVYAYAGYMDNNFWPMSDFGKISLAELKDKDFEWFVNQVKDKRDKPQSILNHFRNKFPQLQQIEVDNNLHINLRLAIILIEHMRHVIVHNRGGVLDKEKFIELVLTKSCLYNNGKFDIQHREFIETFFGSGDYRNTISLLEIRTNPEIPLDIHIDIFGNLAGNLLAYARLIAESLELVHNAQLKRSCSV